MLNTFLENIMKLQQQIEKYLLDAPDGETSMSEDIVERFGEIDLAFRTGDECILNFTDQIALSKFERGLKK